MNGKLKLILIGLAAIATVLTGCGSHSSTNEEGKLKVVATFYPMVEFTQQVAGEHADVIGLIPSGVEPHDWEPSAKDVAAVKEAQVFVYNGIVEAWAEDVMAGAANDKRIVVEASHGIALLEGLPEEEHDAHEEEHAGEAGGNNQEERGHEDSNETGGAHADESVGEDGHEHVDEHGHAVDPHVWLSPVLAQQQIAAIQKGLSDADPAHRADYKKNAEAYIAKLKELDNEFKAGLTNAKRTKFVTQHAAFAYLAQQYGLTQIPISGLSPEEEPSPDRMADIIAFAKDNQVTTIFFETLVDPKVAKTIADEIGAETDVLNPLEGLTAEDIANQLDYIGVMRNNLAALQKALNE